MKACKTALVTFLMAGVLSLGLTACNRTQRKSHTPQVKTEKPDTLSMSKDTLAMRVQQKTLKEIQKQQAQIEKEAIAVVDQTNEALQYIHTGHVNKAEEALNAALDSTKSLLKKHPGAGLVPVDMNVKVQDLITTVPQVDKTVKQAKEEMAKGNYQLAADLLNSLKSEMDIATVNLPLATYPDGLKYAVDLLKKNKPKQAQQTLNQLLNSLVIHQVVLPLPVLRAEVMMNEAQTEFGNKENKEKVLNLLKNADYQLKLAQALGYGHFDKEYAAISKEIAGAKTSVKNGSATSGTFDRLIKKTEAFKNRMMKDIEGHSQKNSQKK